MHSHLPVVSRGSFCLSELRWPRLLEVVCSHLVLSATRLTDVAAIRIHVKGLIYDLVFHRRANFKAKADTSRIRQKLQSTWSSQSRSRMSP